jgi:integrase
MPSGAKTVQKALSDLAIANLKKPGYYWDKLPGFGVRVGAHRKTFIAVRNGRRTTIGVYPHLSLADARVLATQALYAVTSVKTRATVKQATDTYLDQLALRPRTVAEYTRFLTDYMLPKIGTKPIGKVTSADILGITDSLKSTPAECRHTHAAMQTFFNWCIPRYLSASPMAGLKNPVKPKKRSRILADDELKAIWSACCDMDNKLADQFRSIVKLLILTGQRRGEIAALQGIVSASELKIVI